MGEIRDLNWRQVRYARALGRILARPEQQQFVLSSARSQDEKVARAFAAELLAPTEGIRLALETIGKDDDSALESVARRFRVSPLLVRHQYDNQIAESFRRGAW
jgi:Zn-dependent peptidase ImmA (M78 family)